MAASASTTQSARPLADLSGTILLAGAGKMGGALLEGWLALGLAPKNIVVIEPARSLKPMYAIASEGTWSVRVGEKSAIFAFGAPMTTPLTRAPSGSAETDAATTAFW